VSCLTAGHGTSPVPEGGEDNWAWGFNQKPNTVFSPEKRSGGRPKKQIPFHKPKKTEIGQKKGGGKRHPRLKGLGKKKPN